MTKMSSRYFPGNSYVVCHCSISVFWRSTTPISTFRQNQTGTHLKIKIKNKKATEFMDSRIYKRVRRPLSLRQSPPHHSLAVSLFIFVCFVLADASGSSIAAPFFLVSVYLPLLALFNSGLLLLLLFY